VTFPLLTPVRRLAACCALLVLPLLAAMPVAHAERADRDRPIGFSGDNGDANFESRGGTLVGNVVITQGTLTIRADRVVFKQNPDNSLAATAYGNPVSFRQKRDGMDEYYEAYAQRAVYDGSKDLLELFDRALLKRGNDEIRSNYISYNTATEVFKAEGRPDTTGDTSGPGSRVRGVFQPKQESGKAGGDAKAAPKGEAVPLKPAGEIAPSSRK
jgi:lipopolysaccharide export system protein LptA